MGRIRPLLILVAGDPIEAVRARRGGFAEIIRNAARAAWSGPWAEVDARREEAPLPSPGDLAGVVVTGSASSVTERARWMLRAEEYLRDLVRAGTPTFGICFGHQMLAQALGGRVERNPLGREIGTVTFEVVDEDPLLDPAEPPHRANATHVDAVVELPPGATVLARTARDPHAALRFAENAWGVQFHPEMDAAIVRAYLEGRRELLLGEGLDADALLREADDGLAGAATLLRFAARVAGHPGRGSELR